MWTLILMWLKNNWLIVLIAIILTVVSFRIGHRFGKASVKCPTIQQGITVIDTVYVHDTTVIKVDHFKNRDIPIEVLVRDTITKEIIIQRDTLHCISMDTLIGGAFLSAEICSRFFPVVPPLDLIGTFQYRPKPDTLRVRIDTVTFHTPWFKEPKNYIIGGLVAVLGTGIYFHFK
jgi:hypothetical protein